MSDMPTMVRPGNQQQQPSDEILLGRYRVQARRGTGGFGTVCTCWDTRLQRRVAIKRMPIADNLTTADEALAEARTACMLAHPNIVTVYDFESDGTYAYLVMEYIDGLNLAELLARVEGGCLTYDETAHVLQSVARALSFAHDNRVLHLDIKPTNIMIDRQGTVKLADFGMSTLASAAGYGGARGGTVGYMPPEQIEGRVVDERADIFSLAVVLWQALTGQNPFAADTPRTSLDKIVHGIRTPLSKSCPELAGTAESVMTHAFSPNVSDRTASVDQFASELLPCLGSAEEGAASLSRLVNQAERDDGEEETVAWRVRHLPVSVRFPWLEDAIERIVSAVVVYFAMMRVMPSFQGATEQFVLTSSLVAALASALWPPLGSALVGAAFIFVLVTAATSVPGIIFALACGVGLIYWWVKIGRTEYLASAALLLPCCTSTPLAGAAISGFALDPAPATATGMVGFLLGTAFEAATVAGFSPTALAQILVGDCLTPTYLISLVGAAACAFASSSIAMRGTVGSGIAGQGVGLVMLIIAEILAARVENGGIWAAPDWETVSIAVILFVSLCIATVLRGPLFGDQEGETVP